MVEKFSGINPGLDSFTSPFLADFKKYTHTPAYLTTICGTITRGTPTWGTITWGAVT